MMLRSILFLCALVAASVTHAEPLTTRATTQNSATTQPAADHLSVTEHALSIGTEELRYRATAGTMAMKDEEGKLKADVFFVAYEKLPAEDLARRPITYIFNGGPGAAAVWLHLGAAGPKRIKLPEDGSAPAPPYELIDNPHTWLNTSDLVFIDPIGTGYSRPATGENREQFFGVDEDVKWVAEFVRLYSTRYGRWLSPKFLAGESYGTTRAARLSEQLLERHGLNPNGIILISSVLDFQTIAFAPGNDLPYALYLPSYTATAWYHHRLDEKLQADLPEALRESEKWSLDVYLPALAKGADLSEDARQQLRASLARYTGLPEEIIELSDLRIDPSLFRKSLLRKDRLLLGRFDSRLKGYDPKPLNSEPSYDPSLSPFFAAYSGTFNDYVRRQLKYESDLPYEVLSGRVFPWNFGEAGNGYLNVADNLQAAMLKNPQLKVLFASGYFDLATPYLAARYTIDHLNLSADLRKNISQTFYTGGHMMYHQEKSLAQLDDDVSRFIERAVSER